MPDSPDDKIPSKKNRQEHGEPSLEGHGGGVNLENERRERATSKAFAIGGYSGVVNLEKENRERTKSIAFERFSLPVATAFATFICFLLSALVVAISAYLGHIIFDFERTQEALSFVWDVISSGAPLALTVLLWFLPRK